ncbi:MULTISPECIES: ATP-binding protein [Streptomyces]|uniref:ATPase n=1 Tax=Streptomyces viridochromogenes TaxID=1938 RepID=A0A0L8JM14_STRVR|nr:MULTISPECIES: ATP-binding protein [Streptomyces]KOG14708.1 ATPase [Streptomyces viridochromogenes]
MSAAPEALPHRHVLTVPTASASVRLARETAEMTYASWGIGTAHPAMGPALLILSELVTNSVRHAAVTSPSLTVTFAAGEDALAFAVHDRHPYHPGVVPVAGHTGGLFTVAEVLAEQGGTLALRRDADGGGKSVWITLPLRDPLSPLNARTKASP